MKNGSMYAIKLELVLFRRHDTGPYRVQAPKQAWLGSQMLEPERLVVVKAPMLGSLVLS